MAELQLHTIAAQIFKLDHEAVGVQVDADPLLRETNPLMFDSVSRGFYVRAKSRWQIGRYSIEEAAILISIKGAAEPQSIRNGIMVSIAKGELNSYLPGENGIFDGAGVCRPWREEVYGSDMNSWLEKNQSRIGPVFPVESMKVTKSIAAVRKHSSREDILGTLITKLSDEYPEDNPSALFFKLRELAKIKTPPFTGVIEDDGLEYTNLSHNKKLPFKIGALRARIKRRKASAKLLQ
jgi:hypothetical protein